MPAVSVVMGVYNGDSALRATLDSILAQQDVDLEVIIVDDGSTDKTGEVLRDYQARDDRLRVITTENRGLTRALVTACEAARAPLIARHDVGDVSAPDRLRQQADKLTGDAQAVLCYSGFRVLGPGGEELSASRPEDGGEHMTAVLRRAQEDELAGPNHGSVMFRADAYRRAGGYRPEFYFAQDLDLWTRLVELGSVVCVPDVLYSAGFTYGDISAEYAQQQRQLRQVIIGATKARRLGQPEDEWLRQAALVRPSSNRSSRRTRRAQASYFIGSVLAQNGDSRAKTYFRQAVCERPLFLKAWMKLLRQHFG